MIWVALLVRWGLNILALIVVEWLFSGVEIGGWGPLLLGAAIVSRQHDHQAVSRV